MSGYKRRTKLNYGKSTAGGKRKSTANPVPTPVILYVAVVISAGFVRDSDSTNGYESKRPRGDWSAFIHPDKDEVIQKALNAAHEWERTYGKYKILVGQLTTKVDEPVRWVEEVLFV